MGESFALVGVKGGNGLEKRSERTSVSLELSTAELNSLECRVEVVQAEGYPNVRLFRQPFADSEVESEVPSGSKGVLYEEENGFCRVTVKMAQGQVDGWVSRKNAR